ncbi:MAG: hypothetical protein AAB276_06595 [Pseudomonadota bacterium]
MIEMKRVLWTEFDTDVLRDCQFEGFTLKNMIMQVCAGEIHLFGVFVNYKRIGSVLIESLNDTLLIKAVGGETINSSSYQHIFPMIETFAKANGFKKIKAYARDMLRARKITMLGFHINEVELEMDVS